MAGVRIERLASDHDRTGFDCGVAALDRYFREQASQDVRRCLAVCYVAVNAETGEVAGYYTLAAGGVPLTEIPEVLARRLPRYSSVPVARLGRLAVTQALRSGGLGAVLLWDASTRASRSELAVFALVVDAKDEPAEQFYRHHGFAAFGSAPGQLFFSLGKPLAPG